MPPLLERFVMEGSDENVQMRNLLCTGPGRSNIKKDLNDLSQKHG